MYRSPVVFVFGRSPCPPLQGVTYSSWVQPVLRHRAEVTMRSAAIVEPAAAHWMAATAAVTAETERLDQRRELYASVDSLVQGGEFEQARMLLSDDTKRHGSDAAPEWRDLDESYRLVADCLEHPSITLRERAESFVSVSRAISVRSMVVSACSRAVLRHAQALSSKYRPADTL